MEFEPLAIDEKTQERWLLSKMVELAVKELRRIEVADSLNSARRIANETRLRLASAYDMVGFRAK